MTIYFIDGFDHYDDADISQKWPFHTLPGLTACTITANGRRGSGCLTTPATTLWTVRRRVPSGATKCVGMAVKLNTAVSTAGHLITFGEHRNDQLHCYVNTSRQVEVRRAATTVLATSVVTLTLGQQYYLEFKAFIDDTTGTYEVRLDGVAIVGPTGSADTRAGGTATIDEISLGARINQELQGLNCSGGIYIDDLYIADDFLGDCRVDALYPSGAGNSSALTPSAGSNYECVDETSVNGDTDYVSAFSSLPKTDTYAVGNMTHTPTTIHAVQVNTISRMEDSDSRLVATILRSGGTDNAGTTRSAGHRSSKSATYGTQSELYALNPNGSVAWTKAAVAAIEAGVKVIS